MNIDTLIMETVGACNLKCHMCPTIHYEEGKFLMKDILFDKLKRFIENNNVINVDMTGWGEPLLDKKLSEKIIFVKGISPRTNVGFISNGTLFADNVIEEILNSDVNYINISFDGATKDTYEKIRVNANYDLVISRLANLSKLNRRRTSLQSVFVVMKDNFHEMEKHAELFQSLGFNAVVFKPLDVISAKENMKHAIDKTLILKKYEKLKRKYEGKMNVYEWDLSVNTIDNNCLANAAGKAIFVNSNGDVSPCCNLGHHVPSMRKKLFFNYMKMDNFFSFGNILKDDLGTILNTTLYRNFVDAFRNRKLPNVCRGCLLVSEYLIK